MIKIINEYYKNGSSFGAKRINKILKSIEELISLKKYSIVIDDPFDGLSYDNKMHLINLFVKLMAKNFMFVILTNDIESWISLRRNINKKKSTAIIKNYENHFMIDNITSIDNIIFKWNDQKHFEDLKKFIKRLDVNYEIACLLLTIHSELIQDFKYLLELFIEIEKKEIVEKEIVEKLYNLIINYSKTENSQEEIINKKIKKNKNSLLKKMMSNYTIQNKMNVFLQKTHSYSFSSPLGIFFIIESLKKILIIEIYDIIKEELKNNFDFKKEYFSPLQKTFLKEMNEKIKNHQNWRNTLKHNNKFPLIKALLFQEIPEDLIHIAIEYGNGEIYKKLKNN